MEDKKKDEFGEFVSTEAQGDEFGEFISTEPVKKKEPTTLEAGGTSTSALDGGKSDLLIPGVSTMKDLAVTEAPKKQPITEFGKIGQQATDASMKAMEDVAKGKDKLESRVKVTTELAKKSALRSEQLGSQVLQMDNYIKTLEGQPGKEKELNQAIQNRNAIGLELNKEIAKQNAFAKRAQETQQTIEEIPLGNLESVGNSMINRFLDLKMAVPQTMLGAGNIADKLASGAFETYLKLTGADLTDAERKEIAGMSASNVAKVAGQMPGLGDYSSDEAIKERFDQLGEMKKQMLPTKGIIDTFGERDLGGFAAALFDAATSLGSSAIIGASTGGVGIGTTMIGDAIYEYNNEKAKSLGISIDELYNKGLDDVSVPFAIGSIAAALEKVGLEGVSNAINTKIAKAGVKEIANLVFEGGKEGATEWIQTGLETYNTAIASGKDPVQAGEEMWDKMNSKEGYEAALKGLGGSAVSIATGKAAKAIYNSVGPSTQKIVEPMAKKAEVLAAELENPALTTEQANQIEDEITVVTNEIKDQAVSDFETKINLPDEIRVDVDRLEVEADMLQSEIDKKESLLANPSISNDARALLSGEVSELKAKKMEAVTGIEDILNANRKPILQKFTSPTDEMYGTVNRNDGKGLVTLTKEEFLKESGDSGIQEPVASVEEKIEVTGPSEVAGEPGQVAGQESGQEVGQEVEEENDGVTFQGKRGQAESITFDGKTIKQGEEIELSDVNISQDDSMPDLRSGKYKVRMLSVDANGKTATLTLTDGNEVITTTVKDLRKSEQPSQNAPLTNEGNNSEVVESQGQKGSAANPSETDNVYDLSQEVTSNVSKENPEASILIQPKGDDLSLTAVYVGKEKRGKGIGSKVLASVKKEADRVGKKVVLDATNDLDEETDLVRLGKFYESNGFVKVGENKYEYNPKNALSEQKNQNKEENKILKDNQESPKPKSNENQGNEEAEGREEGLLKAAETKKSGDNEPVSSAPLKEPEFDTAYAKAEWLRENKPEEQIGQEDWVDFVAKNSNDSAEVLEEYIREGEKHKEIVFGSGYSDFVEAMLSIKVSKSDWARYVDKNRLTGTIAKRHLKSGGENAKNTLDADLMQHEYEGINHLEPDEWGEWIADYYRPGNEGGRIYAQSKNQKKLAEAYYNLTGKGLSMKTAQKRLDAEIKKKVKDYEQYLQNEFTNQNEAEQFYYEAIKRGEIPLTGDEPISVIKRVAEDRKREEDAKRAIAEAEERRQLNTPRNAIDVARIFRNDFGFTPWESTVAARMFDAKARLFAPILGLTREQYYQRYWLTSQSQDGAMDQETRKGSWSKEAAYAKRIIGMYQKADSTTAIHEILGHDYFDNIIQAAELGDKQSIEDLNTIVEEYIKEKKPKLSKAQVLKIVKDFNIETNYTEAGKEVHEWFATAAERYFASGDQFKPEIANSKLGKLFEKFRQHVANLYQAMNKALIAPSPQMKKVFRRLFGEENFEVLDINDRVIQQAKEDNERVPVTEKASKLVGKLPTKVKKGLSQDEMTPEEILLEAAKDLIQSNESDKYNIVNDLKALVYKETGSKDYWPDIDDLKEQLEAIDKPDEGKIFNATVERALADRNVSPEIKKNLRSKEVRERDTYSLLKQIADSVDVVNMVGPETVANLLLEEEGRADKQFEDYEFVTLASIVAKRLNAMKKGAPNRERRDQLTKLTTDLYDAVSQKGSGVSRALNSFRAWNLLDAEGMEMVIRRKMNKDNGKDTETAKQRAKKMEKEYEKLKKDFDYAFTGLLDSEEVRGRLEEEIAELNKKIEDFEKRKGQRTKTDSKTGKPITKGREFNPKFGIDDVKNFFKNKFRPGLSQEEVTEEDFKEAVADLLSRQKDYSFGSFVKVFNSQMGENYTAKELKDLYETTVDYMTDNGYEGGFSDIVEINDVILDETIVNDAAAAVVKRDLLVKHEKEMKAYMEKQRKAFIEDVANKMNNRELWEQYVNSVTAELISKMSQNLGTGSNTDKALLDEFTSLVKTAIKEKLDEVLPVAKGQPVQKTAKELAENIADLANNEEKFADVFDAMVEKLQEKYKNDVNAVNALQALANIQNPFSDKLLSKAVSKQFEGTGWKLGDVAFGRGTGLMASQMAQQVLSDGGLLGTPAEAVLRPLLEDAFQKNAKKFEDQTLDSLANYIVNDAKKAVGAVSPANKTFVEEMVGALKRKVRENYKANNKTPPADPMELIKFALKETGKADQVGGSLWSQAQGEVIGKIMADPNLTQGQKMDAIDFLRDFSNSVFDTIVPVTTLERAIVRQLKKSGIALDANGNIPWESLIKGVDGQIDALREQVELAIRAELGNNYNPALVDLMVNRIVDQYDSMITEKKKAMFEKQLASFSSEVSLPYVKDRKIGGMVGKLLAMDKSGLLDAQAFNDLVSEYMGIKFLSMQEWNELQYLLRQIEDSPEGFERVTAIENVTLFLESKQPMYGAKVMRAIYYANLLSGFSTAIKNLTGIFDVFFKAVGESALQLDPTYLKLALKGLSQGDFADIIKRGSANQGDKVDIPTDSMGLAHVNTLERWRKYPGLRNKVFGSLAYVSRVLNATDAAVQRSVQEQSDYYLTKKDLKFKNPSLTTKAIREMALANMFRDDITFQKAIEMAVDEMNARGMNVNKGIVLSELSKNPLRQNEDTVRAKRRAYEIMRKNRLDEVRVYSGKDALKTAFKTEYKDNRGVFTFMGRFLIWMFEKIGGSFGGLGEFLADRLNTSEAKKKAIKESFAAMPQTLIMPIIRGVSNVAEASAEKLLFYGPLKGTVKYLTAIDDNNKNFKKINKAMTTNERIEFEYKKMQALDMITSSLAANIFVGVVTAMLMEAVPDDDEELKNGFYAAGASVNTAKRGEKAKMVVIPENSIVIGGEIYSFSWFGTMALSLSAYANYEETKNNEDFGIADFMLGTLSGFLSASMFEPVSRFSEVVSPKFKTDKTMGERVTSWMENIGLSAITNTFMPWSNMQAQIAQGGKMIFKDGMSEDAIGVYEKMVKKMPLLQLIPGVGYDRPSLDYTGDPIPMEVKNPGSAASLFQWAQDRKIPEFKTYDAKIGLNTPFNGKTLDNTIAKETMTDEQYYDYRKDVSVAFKPFQEANFKNLNQYDVIPPENANGDITLATRKKQQEVAISMFGLPYSKLSGIKKNEVNRALNYREASEKAHAAIERYFGKVYMKELGINVDIEEARNDLDIEIYDVLPTEMSNADRQDIADRVLRSSRR